MWSRLAALIVRRTRFVVAVGAVLTALLASGLTQLQFRTDQDTLVDPTSDVFLDNVKYQEAFGGESMLLLFTGDPVDLFSPANVGELTALEDELRATRGVASVVGPYTALRYAVDQLRVAPALVSAATSRAPDRAAFEERVATEGARLAAVGEASLDNPEFVRFLLFEADGRVRAASRAAFPDANHALLVAQLDGNASIDEQASAANRIQAVVARHDFESQHLLLTGSPVLIDEINSHLQGGMVTLGAVAVAVMVAVLWMSFRVRLRLLPLAVMAVGTAAALGAAVLLGIDLSLVTIAGLPIFIGLGVDFAVQMHNRYVEQRAGGDSPEVATEAAVTRMGPPLAVAMVAAACGFLALRLSAVPMIRDFGLLLCVGALVLVSVSLVLPVTLLLLVERHLPQRGSAVSGAMRTERVVGWLTTLSGRAVGALVVVGSVLAGAGFVVEARMPIDTEVERWVASSDGVHDLRHLRAVMGFSSQLGLMVEADDVLAEDVIEWMHRFETTEIERHPEALLQTGSMTGVAADVVGIAPTSDDVRSVLDVAPADIRAMFVSADGRTANLQFPIGDLSLHERGALVDAIQTDLRGDLAPPPGVRVTPSGLAVIGVELVKGMEANRRTLTMASLALVATWLLVRGRFRPIALLPVVPVAMAVGLATLAIWALGFELTPLTTVAAPLVIAVATEFTVLLESRYREEVALGCTPDEACAALPKIGRAFVASGLTLAGGFAVMAASPMTLLRDFGIVVAIDVVVALLSALVVLPPLLRWSHRRSRAATGRRSEVELGSDDAAHLVASR